MNRHSSTDLVYLRTSDDMLLVFVDLCLVFLRNARGHVLWAVFVVYSLESVFLSFYSPSTYGHVDSEEDVDDENKLDKSRGHADPRSSMDIDSLTISPDRSYHPIGFYAIVLP